MRQSTQTTEKLIFEVSSPGRRDVCLPDADVPSAAVPEWAARREAPLLPEVSEADTVRHFTRLSRLNFSVDTHMYPLGSCTMKYNPRPNEAIAALDGFADAHPYQRDEDVQGILRLLWELQRYLCEIAGLSAVTLQPAAGAHGELTGMLMIAAYHRDRGESRRKVLIPDSAHGTNPASATLGGFTPQVVPSGKDGRIDMAALEAMLGDDTAAVMMTNPNTLGIFEKDVARIADLVHEAGGLLYMDGANMNAIMGVARPGNFGVDAMHFNPHKTFAAPHGCGGPGAGPVAVSEKLRPYLPAPYVVKTGEAYSLCEGTPKSIGRVRAFAGNIAVLIKTWAYIRSMGPEGLRRAAEDAVLNARYLRAQLSKMMPLGYQTETLHEFVLSGKRMAARGVHVIDIAKRLLDYGFHPPTVYFPQIVPEAMMAEPTETESLEALDAFAGALARAGREARENPDIVKSAPHTMPVERVDEVRAVREPRLLWRPRD